MKRIISLALLVATMVVVIYSCKKDKSLNNDQLLYREITENGYSYYQNEKLLNGISPQ